MSARKRILFLIFIMIGACAMVMMVMTVVLYRHELQKHREMLQVTAQSQARLIEAVARYDEIHTAGGPAQATLNQIIEAHENFQGFGETGEFTLARRDGNSIVFVLRHRHDTIEYPAPVAFDSELAEPMRRALKGLSGTIIGLDYRGQTVLAAYEPVALLNLGIVAKLDLAEFNTPFFRSGLAAAMVGFLVVLAGTVLFVRISNPIVVRLEAYSRELEKEIEERKRAEATLRSSEERLRAVVDNCTMVIYLKDTEGRYIMINRQFETLLHVTKDEVVGKTDYDLFPEKMADAFRANDQAVLAADAPLEFEEYTPRDDGLHTYISVKFPLRDITGKKYAVCGISTDITERKRMEGELQKIAKLESIGVLAGGIAHDLNNLLTGIVGNLSLARMYKDAADKDTRIEEAEKASFRVEALTKQLLTFSKGGSPVREDVDIGSLLNDWVTFILRGSKVTCEFSIANNLLYANIDEAQINQVINNLIINAEQSMPEGGTVKLAAENILLEKGSIRTLQAGPYIKISVEDEGEGIPGEVQRQIFDPFFTTKQTGSGLGLATSHAIMGKHDGYISVESTVGVGSTFVIYLPAAADAVPAQPKVEDDAPIMGKGHILVMDDEEMIREFVVASLSKLGYKVTTTKDGLEAVAAYKKAMDSGSPLDSVILDLTIPGGFGGSEVIKQLKGIDPDVKAIVASGYSTDAIMANFKNYGFKGCISKPFGISELSKTLHEVLNER